MSKTSKFGLFSALLYLLMIAGCSTTPQAALDQANNGTYLITAMQGEISKFRLEEAAIGKLRLDALRQAQLKLARMDNVTADDDRLYAAAGRKSIPEHFTKIIGLVDARASDEKGLNEKIVTINKAFDNLLTPLPDGTKELGDAQKTMAILGNELSSEDRLRIFRDFAKDIKNSIDENKKKIEDAKESAPVLKDD